MNEVQARCVGCRDVWQVVSWFPRLGVCTVLQMHAACSQWTRIVISRLRLTPVLSFHIGSFYTGLERNITNEFITELLVCLSNRPEEMRLNSNYYFT
jgi:hypothetical protein